MKKTVKLLSGLALVAAIAFVGFSSFDTPEVEEVDCGCPPGWELKDLVEVAAQKDKPVSDNIKYDANGDGKICFKRLPENADGKGNTLQGKGWVIKDNSKPCDE